MLNLKNSKQEKVKYFPSLTVHRVALISISSDLSQTPARPWIWDLCVMPFCCPAFAGTKCIYHVGMARLS